MTTLYLYFNAAMYVVFGLWCALDADGTAANLGYTSLSASGHTEYLAVYGGLQWGLGLMFAYFAAKPPLRRVGVLVAIALYAPIVLHRNIAIWLHGPVATMTQLVAGLEIAMLLAAVALWWFGTRREIRD